MQPASEKTKSKPKNGTKEHEDNNINEAAVIAAEYRAHLASATPLPPTVPALLNVEADRGYWGHKAEFILSCIGLSVGIGNVWRFPYVAYDNGGGAFLIPYLIMLAIVGKPLYYLELAIGQYARLGPGQLFSRMSPITAGIGYAMLYSCFLVCIYYNVIMSYTVYFTAATLANIGGELPWNECNPAWADMSTCWVRRAGGASNDTQLNNSSSLALTTTASSVGATADNTTLDLNRTIGSSESKYKVSTEQYFYRNVLQKFDFETNEEYSIARIGGIVPELLGCLALCWVIVYICLMRGIRSSGKVVYFTATFPYVLLFILLIRGLLLEGAWTGISYFIIPDWNKLFWISTWRAAATQLFFSLSTSMGCLIMFGSYNHFNNNCHYDAILVSSMDTVTSIIAGFVIFAQLGNLAVQVGKPVKDVAAGGLGLAFVVYPEAISQLPWPHLWGVCFFAMLFILGLDSQFALIETIITAIDDQFPSMRKRRLLVTLAVCIVGFLAALPCICRGGVDVVDLMNTYAGSFSLVFVGVYELIAIGWLYGVNRFSADLQFMLGHRPSLYWRICWRYLAPLTLILIIIATFADYQPMSSSATYPGWADLVGWGMALVAILTPPLVALYAWIRADGHTLRRKFQRARTPGKSWGPGDADARHALQQQSYTNPVVSWSSTSVASTTAASSEADEMFSDVVAGQYQSTPVHFTSFSNGLVSPDGAGRK